MTLREHTVAIIRKHNLTLASDTPVLRAAFAELSDVTGISRAYARNRILEALNRIANDLDPVKIERKRNNGRMGRKPKKISLDDVLKRERMLNTSPVSKERILEALATLPKREQRILALRLELHNGRCHTLQEIGDEMQVTRERVRQIQNKGIKHLVAALQKIS